MKKIIILAGIFSTIAGFLLILFKSLKKAYAEFNNYDEYDIDLFY